MPSQPTIAAHQTAIRNVLSRINDAWLNQRGEAMTAILNECFSDDVVMRGPDFALLGKGHNLIVQSYHDFVTQAEVKKFSQDDPEIDITGDTAVAQYRWAITYLLNGQEYSERGRDIFIFVRRDEKWLAVWRAMLTEPTDQPGTEK